MKRTAISPHASRPSCPIVRTMVTSLGMLVAVVSTYNPLPVTADQPATTPTQEITPVAKELRRDRAEEAFQAVAVDADAWFAINNRTIGRYSHAGAQRTHRWEADADSPVKHMNSGLVHDGRLYCANSNWPQAPLVNTVEVLDAATLTHLHRLTFDETDGAINWIDRHADAWWIAYAFYGDDAVHKTYVERLDDQWQSTGKWTFPKTVIQRFLPNSNSGGSFGPDGKLYVTGHDHAELYVLEIPDSGDELIYLHTVPAPIAGQGIAWDRSAPASKNRLLGLVRKTREVVQMTLPIESAVDAEPTSLD